MNLQQLQNDIAMRNWSDDSPLIFYVRTLAWLLLTTILIRVNLFVWGIY